MPIWKRRCPAFRRISGRLLEVPVGTGILTMPLYKTLPKADITCLDYSADKRWGQAQEKTERLHLQKM